MDIENLSKEELFDLLDKVNQEIKKKETEETNCHKIPQDEVEKLIKAINSIDNKISVEVKCNYIISFDLRSFSNDDYDDLYINVNPEFTHFYQGYRDLDFEKLKDFNEELYLKTKKFQEDVIKVNKEFKDCVDKYNVRESDLFQFLYKKM